MTGASGTECPNCRRKTIVVVKIKTTENGYNLYQAKCVYCGYSKDLW